MLKDDILTFRARNNLSQKKFAQLCGLSIMTINAIENDIQEPTKVTREKIRLVLSGEKNNAVVNK